MMEDPKKLTRFTAAFPLGGMAKPAEVANRCGRPCPVPARDPHPVGFLEVVAVVTAKTAQENSPSGLWRTLGKRVGCKPSGVRIPHSPPILCHPLPEEIAKRSSRRAPVRDIVAPFEARCTRTSGSGHTTHSHLRERNTRSTRTSRAEVSRAGSRGPRSRTSRDRPGPRRAGAPQASPPERRRHGRRRCPRRRAKTSGCRRPG